jgi:hypothetical protein
MAALNFPGSPSNADEFEGYIYDATLGVWNRKPNTVAYTVSANAPTSPNDGDVWFNETDGSSYIYYVDADSEQWVEIGGTVGATGARGENGTDGRFTNSATKPAEPVDGDVWFNTNTGQIFVYYNDGTTSQWVESGTRVLAYDTLANLSDTNIPSPSDGQALVYDNATSKWIPGDVAVDVPIYDVTNSSTGFFSIPKGSSEQRPQNPANGDIRFNTDTGRPEWYSEEFSGWYEFHEFPSTAFNVEYLVIAGGGGGGFDASGGGGAGGYRSSVSGESSGGGSAAESPITVTGGLSYNITVGAGGNGSTSNGARGSNGSNSVFASTTSIGGAGGADSVQSAIVGGSGGGAYYNNSGAFSAGTSGQGYSGGTGNNTATDAGFSGGGGGGAGAAGNSSGQGNGGVGIESFITGVSTFRGGGGGAAKGSGYATGGLGGNGGGGNGAKRYTAVNSAGSPNTGGGGGGGDKQPPAVVGASGGSGVVILKYPSSQNISPSVGLSYTTSTVGAYKVTEFTAGTGTVTFS